MAFDDSPEGSSTWAGRGAIRGRFIVPNLVRAAFAAR
jgi:hypothetical protein